MMTSKNNIYYSKSTKDVVIRTRKFEIKNRNIELDDGYVTTSRYLPALKSITKISNNWYYVEFNSAIDINKRVSFGFGHITNPVSFDRSSVIVNKTIANGLIKLYNKKISEWSKDE